MASAQLSAPRRFLDPATEFDVTVKGIIIGDSSVGKSSLLYRYTDSDWNPHYIATIGVDFKVLTFERDAKVVKLQLWDTAGQERFKTITHTYYRGAHGVVVVFDVTNRESFTNVTTWLQEFNQFSGGTDVPMVLVGNKCDCRDERVVSDEEADAVAKHLGCRYVPCSAKANIGVDEAFQTLTQLCLEYRAKLAPPRATGDRRAVKPIRANPAATTASSNCPCS
jgi:small GTP-binding protein